MPVPKKVWIPAAAFGSFLVLGAIGAVAAPPPEQPAAIVGEWVAEEAITVVPVTTGPATPTLAPATTVLPTTVPPTTVPPTTVLPTTTTAAPTTVAPTTVAPTTVAPVTTTTTVLPVPVPASPGEDPLTLLAIGLTWSDLPQNDRDLICRAAWIDAYWAADQILLGAGPDSKLDRLTIATFLLETC